VELDPHCPVKDCDTDITNVRQNTQTCKFYCPTHHREKWITSRELSCSLTWIDSGGRKHRSLEKLKQRVSCGYYRGQEVEVENSDKKWYPGKVIEIYEDGECIEIRYLKPSNVRGSQREMTMCEKSHTPRRHHDVRIQRRNGSCGKCKGTGKSGWFSQCSDCNGTGKGGYIYLTYKRGAYDEHDKPRANYYFDEVGEDWLSKA